MALVSRSQNQDTSIIRHQVLDLDVEIYAPTFLLEKLKTLLRLYPELKPRTSDEAENNLRNNKGHGTNNRRGALYGYPLSERFVTDRTQADISICHGNSPDNVISISLSTQEKDRYQISAKNQETSPAYKVDDIPPVFEKFLFTMAIRSSHYPLVLHAAGLCHGTKGIVLTGPSGAGKTTLTLALLNKGYDYISDEIIGLDMNGHMQGVHRPIIVEHKKNVKVKSPFENSICLPYPASPDDKLSKTSSLIYPDQVFSNPCQVQKIMLIRYTPGQTGQLKKLNSREALCALWPTVMRCELTPNIVAHWLETVNVYSLCSGSVEEALSHIL